MPEGVTIANEALPVTQARYRCGLHEVDPSVRFDVAAVAEPLL
jgi:hypothetical protein